MAQFSILVVILLGFAATALGQQKNTAPPFTKDQYEKIREVVRRTQEQAGLLDAELDKYQQELVRLYREFNLDEAAVKKVQDTIQATQRRQMENFHAMQTEFRRIVSKERFEVLNARILHILTPLNKPAPEKDAKRK